LQRESFSSNHYRIIINKSFNYSNVNSDILYWQFVNGTTNKILKATVVNIAAYYWKGVNTLIATLFHSKSFSFGVPNTQSLETNAKLAFDPKR